MPLFAKARIEAFLPDLPRPAYQDLLAALEREFNYTFGGCTTIRGLEGNYLSRSGIQTRDRVNVVFSDMPFSLDDNFSLIEHYADQLRDAAFRALDEEAVLVAVFPVYHVE